MDTVQRRAPNVGDINDAEIEEREVEEVVAEDDAEERLLKVVVKLGAKENIDIPNYEGSINVE
jgi:hypothetical protein